MKLLIVFIAVLCLNTQSLDVNTVRIAYKEAAHDKTKVEAFHKLLSEITKKNSTTLVAYKGASISLMGKHAKKIKDKRDLFIEGVSFIEFAIKKSPNNIEVHFIRLGIQENSPKLLKYKKNIEEDKHLILKQFNTIKSSALKKHIKDYILQSKSFSDEEKAVILQS